MNPEIKQKWVAALRSGEYKQGEKSLKSIDNRFCCLGVLCDLHSKETGTPWQFNPDPCHAPTYLGNGGVLPVTVRDWADLNSRCPDVVVHEGLSECVSLVRLNDNEGFTFNQIADVIEKSL